MYAGLVQLAAGDAGKRSEIRLLPDDTIRPSPMNDLGPAAAYLTLEALTEVNRPDQEGFWNSSTPRNGWPGKREPASASETPGRWA